MNPAVRRVISGPIAAFYVLALGISWSLWAPGLPARTRAVGWHTGRPAPGGQPGALSGRAPRHRLDGWPARLRELARGTLTVPRCGRPSSGASCSPRIVFAAAALAMALVNGTTRPLGSHRRRRRISRPGRIEYISASFLFYGIGEEVGWRGFLYPALRRPERRLLTAALLVVPFWAFWHLPALLCDRELSRDGARRRGRLAAVAGERERPHRVAHRSRERIGVAGGRPSRRPGRLLPRRRRRPGPVARWERS